MSAGIDYGMGRTNINQETGIRFGVISQHSVSQAWCDSSEADYGEPTCECGAELVESHTDDRAEKDYFCAECKESFWSNDVWDSVEPNGWTVDDGTYKATDCLDADVMILDSPYYTLAIYCSPCVPGAGDLDNADESGVKTYCFGHDWFENGKAPYPVYRVADGKEVLLD